MARSDFRTTVTTKNTPVRVYDGPVVPGAMLVFSAEGDNTGTIQVGLSNAVRADDGTPTNRKGCATLQPGDAFTWEFKGSGFGDRVCYVWIDAAVNGDGVTGSYIDTP